MFWRESNYLHRESVAWSRRVNPRLVASSESVTAGLVVPGHLSFAFNLHCVLRPASAAQIAKVEETQQQHSNIK